MATIEIRIKEFARSLGFDLVGITSAAKADTFPHFSDWLEKGYGGEMRYLERHKQAREHPKSILAEVRSVIMLGMNYKPAQDISPTDLAGLGLVARYARCQDYHEVLWQKLKDLLDQIQKEFPHCQGRGIVDTAPLLERDFSRLAGLGWFGKNTMILNKKLGSYFFIAALLVNLSLQPDEPFSANHCGSCTACLEACPTSAFVQPGVLDARRCISYLTIELKTSVPEELRPGMGNWIFGCDICQEVCPWNRKAPPGKEPALAPRHDLHLLNLEELLSLDPTSFRKRFRNTALSRPKRGGLLRNAAIVLGNIATVKSIPALQKACEDEEPQIREAAQWAIQEILKRAREK